MAPTVEELAHAGRKELQAFCKGTGIKANGSTKAIRDALIALYGAASAAGTEQETGTGKATLEPTPSDESLHLVPQAGPSSQPAVAAHGTTSPATKAKLATLESQLATLSNVVKQLQQPVAPAPLPAQPAPTREEILQEVEQRLSQHRAEVATQLHQALRSTEERITQARTDTAASLNTQAGIMNGQATVMAVQMKEMEVWKDGVDRKVSEIYQSVQERLSALPSSVGTSAQQPQEHAPTASTSTAADMSTELPPTQSLNALFFEAPRIESPTRRNSFAQPGTPSASAVPHRLLGTASAARGRSPQASPRTSMVAAPAPALPSPAAPSPSRRKSLGKHRRDSTSSEASVAVEAVLSPPAAATPATRAGFMPLSASARRTDDGHVRKRQRVETEESEMVVTAGISSEGVETEDEEEEEEGQLVEEYDVPLKGSPAPRPAALDAEATPVRPASPGLLSLLANLGAAVSPRANLPSSSPGAEGSPFRVLESARKLPSLSRRPLGHASSYPTTTLSVPSTGSKKKLSPPTPAASKTMYGTEKAGSFFGDVGVEDSPVMERNSAGSASPARPRTSWFGR